MADVEVVGALLAGLLGLVTWARKATRIARGSL